MKGVVLLSLIFKEGVVGNGLDRHERHAVAQAHLGDGAALHLRQQGHAPAPNPLSFMVADFFAPAHRYDMLGGV